MTIEQVETAALGLPRPDRARLAQALIASLEDESPLEEAWYDVAERRLAQVEAGQARDIPAGEVFASFGLDQEP